MFFIKPYYYFVVYFQSFADGRQEIKNGVVSSFDKMRSQKDIHLLEQELMKKEGSVSIILVSFQRIKNRGEKIKWKK